MTGPEPRSSDLVTILRWTAWSIGAGGLLAVLTAAWVMRSADAATREAYQRDMPTFLLIWGALLSLTAAAYLLVRRR